MNHLYKRNLLKLLDFKKKELDQFLILAKKIKFDRKNNREKQYLKGKNIVLIFEKESTRTRCSFEVACFHQGANVTYIGSGSSHFQYKESIQDTAKTLEVLYDGIVFRGTAHHIVKKLGNFSNVPVWNGLTDKYHPTQILSDLFTIKEEIGSKKCLSEIKLAYIGNASNNIVNSLLESAKIYKFDFRIVSPKEYWKNSNNLKLNSKFLLDGKYNIKFTENIKEGVDGVDFIYTDVWLSMCESNNKWKERITSLLQYQINNRIIKLSRNKNVKILHCLPAIHDMNTVIAKKLCKSLQLNNGLEITNEVFSRNKEFIFKQSENKLHMAKSILISTLVESV